MNIKALLGPTWQLLCVAWSRDHCESISLKIKAEILNTELSSQLFSLKKVGLKSQLKAQSTCREFKVESGNSSMGLIRAVEFDVQVQALLLGGNVTKSRFGNDVFVK